MRLCKFYRYLIYRLSNFSTDTPTINVVLVLTLVHFCQLITLLLVVDICVFDRMLSNLLYSLNNFYIFFPCFVILNYMLFYNKEKWLDYNKEFINETKKQAKIGLLFVLLYLLGSAAMINVIVLLV